MQYYNNVFSKNEKLLGVEVAEKVIRCIYFEKKGDVYHILKTGKFESNHDLNLPGSLTQNISKFLEKELLFPDRIFLTISSKDTVIHQVILPKMSPVEMEEVISGEIEKIPTFYNTSYESIYSSYRFKAESKKVVIAAIPQKTLNFLLENIKKLNFNFKDVDIAPLNLKNILPVFFAQETSPKTKIEQSRAILIVHDECSFLTIVEGEIYKLIYKLPMSTS
ncbi:MAG: hypothetical protein KKD07_01450, partial [Candidatus Omnitrophica bacterium]|nr:hypothetical protein [Candidatus Omnitrophota bacterium]